MKTFNLNQLEQDILKDCISYKIDSVNKMLLYSEDICMHDYTENRLRKLLEDLEELQKKLS